MTGRLPDFPGQLCINITQLGVSLGLSELKCEAVTDFILLWSCKTLSGWSKIGALLPLPTLPRLWTTRSLLRPWTKLAQPCSVTNHLSRLCALFQWERMARVLSCMYLDVLALSNKIYIVIFCGIYWYITYPGPPFPHVITHLNLLKNHLNQWQTWKFSKKLQLELWNKFCIYVFEMDKVSFMNIQVFSFPLGPSVIFVFASLNFPNSLGSKAVKLSDPPAQQQQQMLHLGLPGILVTFRLSTQARQTSARRGQSGQMFSQLNIVASIF